jgi:F-type H+-transporting ATPase subunit a
MPEQLAITRLLNHLFGAPLTSAMQSVGYHPTVPGSPINDTFALEMMVAAALILFFVIVRMSLSVENPNPAQHVAEMIHEFTGTQAESVIGHGYERFQAFVTCILLFILINNLLGLLLGVIPGVETPTANPAVPLGLAVLTFLYYNFHGVREQGPIGYLKHFAGPVWWMSWLLFPVEIVSHLARMMSLTIRLYANMLASDLLTLICFSMIPFLAPTAFLGLHALVAVIQAYVFMLLSMIYLGMAVAHDH